MQVVPLDVVSMGVKPDHLEATYAEPAGQAYLGSVSVSSHPALRTNDLRCSPFSSPFSRRPSFPLVVWRGKRGVDVQLQHSNVASTISNPSIEI